MTVEQQLQDLASFIEYLGTRYHSQSRTIVWGSGYGATLAVWARKKFPHLIAAAWSSSGVYDTNVFTYGPYNMLEYILLQGADEESGTCQERVQVALWQLDRLIDAGQTTEIAERLQLCNADGIQTQGAQEIGWLFVYLLQSIVDVVAHNHGPGLERFCDVLSESSDETALVTLGRWLRAEHSLDCLAVSYAEMVATRRSEAADNVERMLAYTRCTQFGMFAIIDESMWLPERVNLKFYERLCRDVFGDK